MAALVAFMPGFLWDFIESRLQRMHSRWAGILLGHIRGTSSQPKKNSPLSTRGHAATTAVSFLGIAYITVLFVWQAAEFAPALKNMPWWDAMSAPVKALRLDQHWNLFAPRPYTDDGWDITEGHLQDGRAVDMYRGGAALTFDKPTDVYSIYHFSHRRQYTLELRRPGSERYVEYLGRYFCRTWNAAHSGPDHLVSLEHIFMHEETAPPDSAPSPVIQVPVLSYTCQ